MNQREAPKNGMILRYRDSENPEIQKILRYIERTNKSCMKYELRGKEITAMFLSMHMEPFAALNLSYLLGQARGYRAGEKEARKC